MIRIGFFVLVGLLLDGCSQGPDFSTIDDSEEVWILALKQKTSSLLAVKDYDGLEKLAMDCRAQPSHLASGMAVINTFDDGLTRFPELHDPDAFAPKVDELKAWCDARPDSVTAKIALAMEYTHIAWAYRGDGYGDTVDENGASGFSDNLRKAKDLLLGVREQHMAYPEWYNAMNSVGQGLGQDTKAYLARNREATQMYPQATEIYGGPVIYLLPRWGGSDDAVFRYITQSADELGGAEGDILYARLVTKLFVYSYDMNVFTEFGLSWRRAQRGFELICKRYPHSTYMANAYCVVACTAGDQDTARLLFEKLGNHYFQYAWGSRQSFDSAKCWANLPRPPGHEQITGKDGYTAPDGK